jgi:hypothetical protein
MQVAQPQKGYPHPYPVNKFSIFNGLAVLCGYKVFCLLGLAAESSQQRAYRVSAGLARTACELAELARWTPKQFQYAPRAGNYLQNRDGSLVFRISHLAEGV